MKYNINLFFAFVSHTQVQMMTALFLICVLFTGVVISDSSLLIVMLSQRRSDSEKKQLSFHLSPASYVFVEIYVFQEKIRRSHSV